VVDPDPDPAGVAAKIVNPIGHGLAEGGIGEVMDVDPLGLARGQPFAAAVGDRPTSSFFLGVHRDDRLPGAKVRPRLLVEVAELGVAVGVGGAHHGLDRALQPVALLA
jgi:hypothetical protein